MATANLRKGQRVELAKGLKKLRIELTWQASRKAEAWDLDIMGIELDEDQLLCKDDVRRFVFYGNEKLSDPEGALVHSGDDRTGEGDGEEMILNLDKLNPDVKEIMFILNIFESMKNNQTSEKLRILL